MTHLNPDSYSVSQAFAEPLLASAKPNERFQFQRLGYFVCDKDSSTNLKVFNKTVGLRDTWGRQVDRPKTVQVQDAPITTLNRLGKKFTSFSEDKQKEAISQINSLTDKITIEELTPLFNTAAKKTGTRLVTLLALKNQLSQGVALSEAAKIFIEKAQQDDNPLLSKHAQDVKL